MIIFAVTYYVHRSNRSLHLAVSHCILARLRHCCFL